MLVLVLVLVLASGMVLAECSPIYPIAPRPTPTACTLYISNRNGDDRNSGTERHTAVQSLHRMYSILNGTLASHTLCFDTRTGNHYQNERLHVSENEICQLNHYTINVLPDVTLSSNPILLTNVSIFYSGCRSFHYFDTRFSNHISLVFWGIVPQVYADTQQFGAQFQSCVFTNITGYTPVISTLFYAYYTSIVNCRFQDIDGVLFDIHGNRIQVLNSEFHSIIHRTTSWVSATAWFPDYGTLLIDGCTFTNSSNGTPSPWFRISIVHPNQFTSLPDTNTNDTIAITNSQITENVLVDCNAFEVDVASQFILTGNTIIDNRLQHSSSDSNVISIRYTSTLNITHNQIGCNRMNIAIDGAPVIAVPQMYLFANGTVGTSINASTIGDNVLPDSCTSICAGSTISPYNIIDCLQCPINMYAPTPFESHCSYCPWGSERKMGERCTLCPAGLYNNVTG